MIKLHFLKCYNYYCLFPKETWVCFIFFFYTHDPYILFFFLDDLFLRLFYSLFSLIYSTRLINFSNRNIFRSFFSSFLFLWRSLTITSYRTCDKRLILTTLFYENRPRIFIIKVKHITRAQSRRWQIWAARYKFSASRR